MPDYDVLLLRVAAMWPLPGLGLLVLPEGATPRLMSYPLHTPLLVAVVLPNGNRHRASATVEEIVRTAATERSLLLDFGTEVAEELAVGTEIWLLEETANALESKPEGNPH